MKRIWFAFVLASLSVPAVAADPAPPPASPPPDGFTTLFNGKDFTGLRGYKPDFSPAAVAKMSDAERAKWYADWTADLKKNWSVENGELVNHGHGAYVATKDYGDVEFLIEYKMEQTVDSGIYLKGTPQVQVWDPDDARQIPNGNKLGSGGLWNNPKSWPGRDPLVRADKPTGEWNKFRIYMVGERVSVWLNDKLVVDHARLANYFDHSKEKNVPLPKVGPILLQTHGPNKEIRWRNMYAREIPVTEANAYLATAAGDGFETIFNGKDLDGWQGATDQYEVRDGAIVCKPKKGGNLYTKKDYSDFQVALEIKLPKNGNNGLGIRYPGTGDCAYTGMCELQVLDDDYKEIDPRQAHGSAYGMVAAARGYQRPIGEWNYEVCTIKGSTIKVELNGFQILDCDLSKVTEFMANSKHPGKDRTTGYFGFLGHNDPVMFRNVRIKSLATNK
ncbi:MAG TPA: DUF1080 domain-containing protein [Fimbriiglobus sp.]|jgi:hypothetical protein